MSTRYNFSYEQSKIEGINIREEYFIRQIVLQ